MPPTPEPPTPDEPPTSAPPMPLTPVHVVPPTHASQTPAPPMPGPQTPSPPTTIGSQRQRDWNSMMQRIQRQQNVNSNSLMQSYRHTLWDEFVPPLHAPVPPTSAPPTLEPPRIAPPAPAPFWQRCLFPCLCLHLRRHTPARRMIVTSQ